MRTHSLLLRDPPIVVDYSKDLQTRFRICPLGYMEPKAVRKKESNPVPLIIEEPRAVSLNIMRN